jgi:aldehyde dehydrogenase (NAD+)
MSTAEVSMSSSERPRGASAGTVDEIPALVKELRAAFDSGKTRPIAWRLQQVAGLGRLVREREAEIAEALHADLGKPRIESFIAESNYVRGDAEHVIKHLASWMKPEKVRTPLVTQPGTSRIHREPLGVALIVGPWNYPFQLVIEPLLGALAAGNCALIKPSEVAPATSALLARWLPQYVDPECVKVVLGGVPETTALLRERFDHIFYTGNGAVGRIVMEAAAKHLTPVTLELGGKSPCFIDKSADLDVTARRIAWGKFYNAGQTCVAPDYLLAHEEIHDALLDRLQVTLAEFYGADPQKSPDYGRVVNSRHLQRLMKLLGSGRIVAGGQADEADRYLAPTVLADVKADSAVMEDEIFGPILPVLRVRDVNEAVSFINARPKPLALYVFAGDGAVQDQMISRTSSGGATINHAWLHLVVRDLPFGGVGPSGMGAYHGRASFETFSHRKSVLKKPTAVDPDLLYPPYTEAKTRWIKRLL